MIKNTQEACVLTIRASAELPKYRFISFAGGLCTNGDKGLGVSVQEASVGQPVPVQVDRVAIVEVGEPVVRGALIASDAFGRVKPDSGGGTMGYALEAGSPGDFIMVLVNAR